MLRPIGRTNMLFNNELKVGDKAMIIGAYTSEGKNCIGKIVTLLEFVPKGTKYWAKFPNDEAEVDLWLVDNVPALNNIWAEFVPKDTALFDKKFLMPLPKIEDPGIEDCTFTPIKQAEKA